DHVARQCGHSAARNRTRQPRSEELRYLFEVALNAQEIIAEEQRRHTEGHFFLANRRFAQSDARVSSELHSDERNDQEVRLRTRGHRRKEKESGGISGDSAQSQSRQGPVRPSQRTGGGRSWRRAKKSRRRPAARTAR